MTQLRKDKLEEIKYRAETQGINAGYQPEEILAMVNRLLAAEGQKPVAYIIQDSEARLRGNPGFLTYDSTRISEEDINEYEISVTPLYAAPQPVAVPDVLLSAMEEVLRISDRDHEAWHRARDGIAAYRAAMLNAEPVSQPYTLPQWIPCSERMPEDKPGHSEYLVYETLNNRVQHDYWVVTGEWDFRQFWNHYGNYVTHWMPLPAAPQEPTK